MKLDATDLRYLSSDVFRVLTAVEMGSKNHEVVPTPLIAQISGLRSGGTTKCLGELSKRGLVKREANMKYEGYRLTYGGYDFLAVRALSKRDSIYSVGNQIGTGKESDIYVVATEEGEQRVLKVHRLGRISFRTIKEKRDYLQKRRNASWMYMSRLAAQKEYAFMRVLHEHGFPVPVPIDQARHTVVMSLIDAFPLRQIRDLADPGALYSRLMDLIVRLARAGLIHGDFNEFNVLVKEPPDEVDDEGNTVPGRGDVEPILIDFPQMVSTEHENAEYYFNRDVACIRAFFLKRFRYESRLYPHFTTVVREGKREMSLDVEVEASGFGRGESRKLEEYMEQVKRDEGEEADDGSSDEGEGSGSDPEATETTTEHLTVSRLEALKVEVAGEDEDERTDSDAESSSGSASGSDDAADKSESDEVDAGDDGDDHRRTSRRKKPSRKVQAPEDVSALVASNLAKQKAARERKHHSKKSARDAGRRKGSKAKADKKALVSTDF